MGNPGLIERIQELTDLELALLVSLVAGQHCLIEAEEEAIYPLQKEIKLIATNVFCLPHAVVECSTSTTLEQLSNGILIKEKASEDLDDLTDNARAEAPQNSPQDGERLPNDRERAVPWAGGDGSRKGIRNIASIIILRDLDLAEEDVQIQALELLRKKRSSTFYSTSKEFLIVFIKNISRPSFLRHLNDHIFISYHHDIEDGFANLEESSGWAEDDCASLSSVVHHSEVQDYPKQSERAIFPPEDIGKLIHLSEQVTVAAEVKAYLQNIVTFLRLHRAVEGGISPRATRHFDLLVKCLAPLHQLDYVTPSIVALAARKIYPHRIIITAPENERSMQYGSQLAAVATLLDGVTPEQIIEEVIESVEAPL